MNMKKLIPVLIILALLFPLLLNLKKEERMPSKIECTEGVENPPVWSVEKKEDWERGKAEGLEQKNGYIKLKGSARTGNWTSATKSWSVPTDYLYMDTDSQVTEGKISVTLETSNDNFETTEEKLSVDLETGEQSFGICGLNSSKEVRIKVNMTSDISDKELTTLHGIWIYFQPRKVEPEENRLERFNHSPQDQ